MQVCVIPIVFIPSIIPSIIASITSPTKLKISNGVLVMGPFSRNEVYVHTDVMIEGRMLKNKPIVGISISLGSAFQPIAKLKLLNENVKTDVMAGYKRKMIVIIPFGNLFSIRIREKSKTSECISQIPLIKINPFKKCRIYLFLFGNCLSISL